MEDDKVLIRFWKRFSSHLPFYKIMIQTNPGDALKILADEEIDIILTDLAMPEMSGLELIKKAKGFNPHIKTVLTTGHMPHLIENDLLEKNGFLHIIPKPYRNLKNLEGFLSMLGENAAEISMLEKNERSYVWNL